MTRNAASAPSLDALVPVCYAAQLAWVRPVTIHAWHTRGHLEPVACDVRTHRNLYRYSDVLEAERATRRRGGARPLLAAG